MKIGAVFTGGTIGSIVGADGFITVSDACRAQGKDTKEQDAKEIDAKGKDVKEPNMTGYKLLDLYYSQYDTGHEHDFVIEEPYTILSENLDFTNVKALAECVDKMQNTGRIETENFAGEQGGTKSEQNGASVNSTSAKESDKLDGIIIMHGTDTLQYSAGFLHHMLTEKKIPIILVSSAYVLDDPKANGLDNFKLAMDYIEKCGRPGVYISYVNSNGRKIIHRADMVMAHNAFDSDLCSVCERYYAEEINGAILINKYWEHDTLRAIPAGEQKCAADFAMKRVAFLHVYPGIELNFDMNSVDVILIESYHSGTVSVGNRVAALAQQAGAKGIPVYLVGISSGVSQYETVKVYEQLGIVPLYDEAPISAYCRLCCGK